MTHVMTPIYRLPLTVQRTSRGGGGGLPSRFKPHLRLRHGLALVLETVREAAGSPSVEMTPRRRTTLTHKSIHMVVVDLGVVWGNFFDNAPHQTEKHPGHPL